MLARVGESDATVFLFSATGQVPLMRAISDKTPSPLGALVSRRIKPCFFEAWAMPSTATATAAFSIGFQQTTHGLSWGFRIQGLGGFHPVPWYNSNCTKERSSRTIQVPGTGWNQPSPRPLKHQLRPCSGCAPIHTYLQVIGEEYNRITLATWSKSLDPTKERRPANSNNFG